MSRKPFLRDGGQKRARARPNSATHPMHKPSPRSLDDFQPQPSSHPLGLSPLGTSPRARQSPIGAAGIKTLPGATELVVPAVPRGQGRAGALELVKASPRSVLPQQGAGGARRLCAWQRLRWLRGDNAAGGQEISCSLHQEDDFHPRGTKFCTSRLCWRRNPGWKWGFFPQITPRNSPGTTTRCLRESPRHRRVRRV